MVLKFSHALILLDGILQKEPNNSYNYSGIVAFILWIICPGTDIHSGAVKVESFLTYDFFQNVDLIEKHTLFFLVHVALPKHLDGSLCCRFPVYAHANLTECACKHKMVSKLM